MRFLFRLESPALFRIKICGVTQPADAAFAAAAGADAIGLNFYALSARCLERQQATEIAAATPGHVRKVGLFVNAPLEQVRELHALLGLDVVQLHGDESPEYVAGLAGTPVVKAFRLATGGEGAVTAFVAACQQQRTPLAAVLLDAFQAGTYGGTGHTADWQAAAALRRQLEVPVILAGGLTATNVAAAIAAVQPYGVDTASGVESAPGRKDPQQVQAFVAAAREALA